MAVTISRTISVKAPAPRAFDIAVSMPPADLVKRHLVLPGVSSFTGANVWREVGETRRLTLEDNSSVCETLTAIAPGASFAYRAADFTGIFGRLVSQARAEWHFTRTGPNDSQIDWTYAFEPKHPLAEPFLWFIVKFFWPGYMLGALTRIKIAVENQTEIAAS